ncbi:MAG: sensor histidine kinase [Alphaproteobacteria bacterium]
MVRFQSPQLIQRDGGTVAIRSQSLDADSVRFSISDTCEGIPLEHQAALFNPSDRLGLEAAPIVGTSIGLTITKHLVNLMDGKIRFESPTEEGSTFWIDLPSSEPMSTQRISAIL